MAQLNSLIVTGNSRFLNPINGNARNGVYYVKGTQTASTSAWTGNIPIPTLYDGLTIMYYLPYASTATSVTLNLTLSNGTTTGAVNCYIGGSNRITTHFGVASSIKLTYYSAGSISISGTATTDNRWISDGQWNSQYNFSGTTFYSGNSNTATHDANSMTSNGSYYYTSNGPAQSLGATANEGSIYSQAYNASWVTQLAQDYRNGNVFVRGKNNGTWTNWKKVDAGTVGGHTVAKDVPSNAVFTDHYAWSDITSKPTATENNTTGISIADHTTGSITGVQSSTTTASKVTLGTAISVPNVTSAGSASTWAFENITVPKAATSATSIPNVTAVGSGSFTATVTNGVLSFSHVHTAPTLGTAISVTGVSGSTTASHVKSGGNGTAPTLGTAISIPNVTGATDVTVPIKNTSATTVVTSKTHTVTDNGHTHTLS